jgi:hypothetical protein
VGTVLCGADHSDGATQALRVAADLCARSRGLPLPRSWSCRRLQTPGWAARTLLLGQPRRIRETRQRIPILRPVPPLGESRRDACSPPDSHPSGIVSWRREQLLQAGLPLALAASVALIPHYDVHEVLRLIRRGCPPELAVQILAPLDGQAVSIAR